MLSKISWSQFFTFLFWLSLGYYFVVALLFYRSKIRRRFRQIVNGKTNNGGRVTLTSGELAQNILLVKKTGNDKTPAGTSISRDEHADSTRMSYSDFMLGDPEEDTPYNPLSPEQVNALVHDLLEELKDWLDSVKINRPEKADFLRALQTILKKYAVLKTSSLLHELNLHLIAECKNNGSITLTEAEILRLWKV